MTTIPQPASPSSSYTLKYDAWNRLVEVKDGSTVVGSYEYDALNRRIVKTVGSDTYHYFYTQSWQVLEVRDGSETGSTVEQYVWHPQYVDSLAARYYDSNSDNDFLDTNEIHFAAQDANYNVTALVNASASVIERYEYSPYGELAVLDADFSADADGASDVANPVTFTGRRLDDESGLYYYRNRYYHGQLGRFVVRDPLGYVSPILSLYTYTEANPTARDDPFGTDSESTPRELVSDYLWNVALEYEDYIFDNYTGLNRALGKLRFVLKNWVRKVSIQNVPSTRYFYAFGQRKLAYDTHHGALLGDAYNFPILATVHELTHALDHSVGWYTFSNPYDSRNNDEKAERLAYAAEFLWNNAQRFKRIERLFRSGYTCRDIRKESGTYLVWLQPD